MFYAFAVGLWSLERLKAMRVAIITIRNNLMHLFLYLSQPFAQHALLAATLVAVSCGFIGPFVITRSMAFAVHGTSELAFTGAAAGLLIAHNPVAGALVGALIVSG